jgi:8-oxo-dGTP diphosphatase
MWACVLSRRLCAACLVRTKARVRYLCRMTPQTIICIAAVVRKADRILLVRQAPGHSLQGQWTVPWGRLEAGESPSAAVLRETWEEGGIRADVEGLLGVQELPEPWKGWIALAYLCRHLDGECQPDGRETDAARYFRAPELVELGEPVEPWSAWLISRVFDGRFQSIGRNSANPFKGVEAFL